jgi:FtsP/CotA-like multicopper oxidase with cupredoxin domain
VETTRRDVLKIGGLGALGVVGATSLPWGAGVGAKRSSGLPAALMPRPFRSRFTRPPLLRAHKTTRDADGALVDHFEVTQRAGRAEFAPGLVATVFGYNGIAPGPTLKLRHGRRAVLRVRNHLPELNPLTGTDFTTSVHLHGSASLPQYDGFASDVTPPGFYKDYHYPDIQHARTLWYHDHGVHHTAQNAYSGLYAQYHLHDAAEMDLLPQGEFDVPLIVGDARLGTDGELEYDDRSHSGLMGDVILVNGKAWPVMKVRRRVYRFRVLVAATARSFRFALDTGDPMTMVATDGGLMPQAVEVDQWRHAMAERYEVLIDFRRYRPGQRVVLRNLSNPNNVDYADTDKVMAFDVTDAPVDKRDGTWNRIPQVLVSSHSMDLTEASSMRTRRQVLKREGGEWKVNGHTWEDVVASNFQLLEGTPGLGDVEIWELDNPGGGWFHPAHIHLVDFKILSRNGRPPFPFEMGPKDTAYLGEGEAVRVLVQFGPHRGRYMVHCHNLAHEDNDMMVQYAVGWKPGQPDPNDPILASPARVDNLPRNPS